MKKIYLGTVALEKNRWVPGRTPSFNVSDFLTRVKDDGFYGIELWQYHYTLASDEERARLAESGMPFMIGTYISLVNRDDEVYKAIGDAAKHLGATGIKFNFGRSWGEDVPPIPPQIENLKRLAEYMPDNTKLLCECHHNTVMEVPEVAGEVFAKLDKERFGAIIHLETKRAFADRCFDCYGDRISHMHCAYKAGTSDFQPMDDGSGRVEELLKYYVGRGFNGSLALEFVKFEDSAELHYANAVNELKHLSSVYNSL